MNKRPVTVEYSSRWLRLVGTSWVYYPVTALTGVSVTFAPLFLYQLGRADAALGDWRVLLCFLQVVLVPLVYFRLGAPVLRWARESHKARGESE